MKIGVYGLGGIGRMHARNAAVTPGVTEVVLIGRDPARLEAVRSDVQRTLDEARREGIQHAPLVTTMLPLEEVLEQLDGVIVATATSTHAELARVVAR